MAKHKQPNSRLPSLLGRQVYALRTQRGWTQGELAERVRVEPETISRLERGAAVPSLLKLEELAWQLDISLAGLVGPASTLVQDQAQVIANWIAELGENDRHFVMEATRNLCRHLKSRTKSADTYLKR
jgi:transcriptional regulator with XRE-family HTH domain